MAQSSIAQKSFRKALFLAGLFVVAFIMYYFLSKDFVRKFSANAPVSTQGLFNGVVTDYNKEPRFNDLQKDSVRKSLAGFWIYTDTTDPVIHKTDCIEFKENGYIWEVAQWKIRLPSGDSVLLSHAYNSFCSPYAKAPYDQQKMVSEVHVVRQAFIKGNDTCYGASQVDELWEVYREGDGIRFNHRAYLPYKGELSKFFPEGMVALVDNVTLAQCSRFPTLAAFAKEELINDLTVNPTVFSPGDLIAKYYTPMVVSELTRRFPDAKATLPDSLSVRYNIALNGQLTNLHMEDKVVRGRFEAILLEEMGTWKVPHSNYQGSFVFKLR